MENLSPIVPPVPNSDEKSQNSKKRKRRRRSRNNKGSLVATTREPRMTLTLRELQDELVSVLDVIAERSNSNKLAFDPSSSTGVLIINLLSQLREMAESDASQSGNAFDPLVYKQKIIEIFAATPFADLVEDDSLKLFSTEFIRATKTLIMDEFTSKKQFNFAKLAQFAMQVLYKSQFGKHVNPLNLLSSLSKLVSFK